MTMRNENALHYIVFRMMSSLSMKLADFLFVEQNDKTTWVLGTQDKQTSGLALVGTHFINLQIVWFSSREKEHTSNG